MPRFLPLVLLAALGYGGYYFATHYRVDGLDDIKLQPLNGTGATSNGAADGGGVNRKTIRVASANLARLDGQKLNDRETMARIVEIIRRFDLVAVQGIWSHNQGLVLDLLGEINKNGHNYDFAIPSRVGREPVERYGAFFFDRAAVEIDRSVVFEVGDPRQIFYNKPFVAAFRVRGPKADEAFTFTAVNVDVDPTQADLELALLADVFRKIRDDGRGEDDVLLIGSFAVDENHLGALGRVPDMMWSIAGRPTTVLGNYAVDNILFASRATVEFAGRAGALDLVREFDLDVRGAMRISEHLPVWAEFSVFEGGQVGRIASAEGGSPR